MNGNNLKLLSEITGRILEEVGKGKIKDYSKWQLQCLAFRIRKEAELLKEVIEKP